MGLDMYLMKVKKTDHTVDELHEINESISPTNNPHGFVLRKYEYLVDCYTIFLEAGYWRKFNALHGWFVENVQGGTDDCNYYLVTEDNIREILALLEQVRDTKNTDLLEPVGGFFFGPTDIDEWYWEDVNNSITKFENILKEADWDFYDYYYHSSW